MLQVLFPNDSVVMLLARVVGMFGPIDMGMLARGQETHKYFTSDYDLYHRNEVKLQSHSLDQIDKLYFIVAIIKVYASVCFI